MSRLCKRVKDAIREAMQDANCKLQGVCVIVYDGQNYFYLPGDRLPKNTELVLKLVQNPHTQGWSPEVAKRSLAG